MMGKPLHDQVARCGWPGHCGWSGHDGSWGLRPRMIRGVYWRSVWIGDPGDEFGRGLGSEGDGPKRDGSRWGVDERTCKIRAAHMDDADYLGVANGT